MTITTAAIVTFLKSPFMLPIVNLFLVEGLKNFFEGTVAKVPNKLMLPIVAGLGAALGEMSFNDPALGGLLGLVSSKLHDELVSRKRAILPAGAGSVVVPALLIMSLLSPPLAFAMHGKKVCAELDADTATVEIRLRPNPTTVDAGTPTSPGVIVVTKPRSEFVAGAPCVGALSVGVPVVSLGVPDNKAPGYGIKAVAVDSEGHRSPLSVEVVPSPVPLDTIAPVAPASVEVRGP